MHIVPLCVILKRELIKQGATPFLKLSTDNYGHSDNDLSVFGIL